MLESPFNNVAGKFCETFKKTFLTKHLRNPNQPAARILKKLPQTLFKHFVQEEERTIGRCSFNQNPQDVSQ